MRVVLDVNILVRANDHAVGLARQLLRELVRQKWIILISSEMLIEVGRVLRYPRLKARFQLTELDIYDYIQFLGHTGEVVAPRDSISIPIRDATDEAIVRTAIAGEADFICTLDEDFYDARMSRFLSNARIRVVDDVTMMRMLRAFSHGEKVENGAG